MNYITLPYDDDDDDDDDVEDVDEKNRKKAVRTTYSLWFGAMHILQINQLDQGKKYVKKEAMKSVKRTRLSNAKISRSSPGIRQFHGL
ncbi:hypothetical protein BOTNAR_0056g00190 [Botryotinia narcissicola]|uniref:Uncharacterized protein n=1 Tax=Botryotinia narcissicola TaxID=278944 RepID=A0A4Z1J501_9HELO|nr:hypothetical protein BOTNAR_0056g00190 [Botryotinia narcissicola]